MLSPVLIVKKAPGSKGLHVSQLVEVSVQVKQVILVRGEGPCCLRPLFRTAVGAAIRRRGGWWVACGRSRVTFFFTTTCSFSLHTFLQLPFFQGTICK